MKLITILFMLMAPSIMMAQAPVQAKPSITKEKAEHQPLTALLGAFAAEVNILEKQLHQKKVITIQGLRFMSGVLNGCQVVIAQTGIGKVNAAITTTLLLDHFKPREVIFTGIAGGVNPELLPGDIVIGQFIAHHDYGTITPDSMLLRPTRNPVTMVENPVYFSSDSILLSLAEESARNLRLEKISRTNGDRHPKIIKGTIVTGDVFVSSVSASKILRIKHKADATEMEGAAVAQTCWQQQVPFIVIRSLSDNAGDNAFEDVRKFYEVAARNSAALVVALLGKLAEVK